MANYTANYGLHQWEPEDSFLRTDFNEDLAKIDAALGRAERSGQASAYNVYNLMLQNYYESKYTGYKKALLFDGFMDGEGIGEKSEALIRAQNRLLLTRAGQEDLSLGYGSGTTSIYRGVALKAAAAGANGCLTGWTIRAVSNGMAMTKDVSYTVSVGGALAAEGAQPISFGATGTPAAEQTMTLPTPIPVAEGDTVSITLKAGSSDCHMVPGPDSGLGGVLRFTPAGAAQAALTSRAEPLPARNRILAWVRHRGGTVSLAAVDGGTAYPMTALGTAPASTLQGEACTETAFRLEDAPGGESLALALGLALNDGEERAELFDYGAAML